jgi:hypothetical protein
MRVLWPSAAMFALLCGACLGPDRHQCTDSAECTGGVGGVCEPTGYCSFWSDGCQRYGAGAGPLADQCVTADADAAVADAAPDAAPILDGPGPDGPAPDATGDGDGDGVLDDRDNCPTVPNADQHNEDGDRQGDLCDGCPHVASNMPSDADGDGVGDGCDPDGATAHTVVRFETWAGMPVGVPGWTAQAGQWGVSGDVVTAQQASPAAWMTRPLAPALTTAWSVEVRVIADAVASSAFIGVLVPADLANAGVDGCAVVRTNVGGTAVTSVGRVSQGPTSLIATGSTSIVSPGLAAGSDLVITGRRFRGTDGNWMMRCTVRPFASTAAVAFDYAATTALSSSAMGVAAGGVTARFTYLWSVAP